MAKVSTIGTDLGIAYICVGIFTRRKMEIGNPVAITDKSDDEKQMALNSADFAPAKGYQRQATKNDSNIAGFDFLRIINEPVLTNPAASATKAYKFYKGIKSEEGRHVLILDLGSGTFVVSVLNIKDVILKTKLTIGGTHLSDEDAIDSPVVSHFLVESKEKHKNMATNARLVHCLRTACERAKRMPFSSIQASLEINNLFEGIDFPVIDKKVRFENLNTDLFRETMGLVKKVLRNAEMAESQVHDIALVNRAKTNSEFPLLKHFFSRKMNKKINPDEAIAYGVAIQFAILSSDQHFIESDVGSLYFKDMSTKPRKRRCNLSDGKHKAMRYSMPFYQWCCFTSGVISPAVLLHRHIPGVTDRHNRTSSTNEEELFKTYSIMLTEYRKNPNQLETVFNTDVLINIFSYVPLSQWPELECVSKQFQQIIKILYKNLKSLDFSSFNIPPDSTRKRNDALFTKLMNSCTSLKSLTGFDKIFNSWKKIEDKKISLAHFDKLKGLSHLTVVGFEYCHFNVDDFSKFLTYFPDLRELSIRYCTLESKHLAEPENCLRSAFQTISGLKVLVLNGFDTETFTGTFLSYINAERMERLDLFNSNFQAKHLRKLLNRCKSLKYLVLHFNQDSTLETFELESLKQLSLTNSEFSFNSVNNENDMLRLTLATCGENLRDFRLDKVINGDMLKSACESLSADRLEFLVLSLGNDCTSEQILALNNFYNLKSFTLKFSGSFIPKLVFDTLRFENLQILKLCNDKNDKVSVSQMKNIDWKEHMKNLRKLTLVNIHVDWELLEKWEETNFISRLTHLTLQNCCSFHDDKTISLLAKGCRNVRHLDLSFSRVNDSMVKLLADNCNMLEHLTLTPNLTTTVRVSSLLYLLDLLSTKRLQYLAIDDYLLKALMCEQQFSQYKRLVHFDSSVVCR